MPHLSLKEINATFVNDPEFDIIDATNALDEDYSYDHNDDPWWFNPIYDDPCFDVVGEWLDSTY